MTWQDLCALPAWAPGAKVQPRDYDAACARALSDPTAFWLEQAQRLDWITAPTRADESSFAEADFAVRWFADGQLNIAANCLDRHLATRGEQTAILWEPDDPAEPSRAISYRELHAEVCRFANVLKAAGATRRSRVTLYLPMIPEAAVAMLACARIGAIHSIVFGGFSPDALAGRITDCDSTILVTADEGRRGGKRVPLKANADKAAELAPCLDHIIVVRATGGDVAMTPGRDHWYHEAAADVPPIARRHR